MVLNIPKIGTGTWDICYCPTVEQFGFFNAAMSPKDADVTANSVDPD